MNEESVPIPWVQEGWRADKIAWWLETCSRLAGRGSGELAVN